MNMKDKEVEYRKLLSDLRIDCAKCSGLCCVALYCSKTDGFPENKEDGVPCKHLQSNFQCDRHAQLVKKNMKGCLIYECVGAGQKVTKMYAESGNWKTNPKQSKEIYEVFLIVHQLHQMLWYLAQALGVTTDDKLANEIGLLIQENEQITSQGPGILQSYDLEGYRTKVNKILRTLTEKQAKGSNEQNKNYFGKNLKGKNLEGKDFSRALMIASNLEHCNLRGANFLGADMRDMNLKNANLSESLFLTQMQINSAKGNKMTNIPSYLVHPSTWE